MPEELYLSQSQQEVGDASNLIKTFFTLRRWLDLPPGDLTIMTRDTSSPSAWKKDDIIQLPKDKKYQHCLFKLSSRAEADALELTETADMPDKSLVF